MKKALLTEEEQDELLEDAFEFDYKRQDNDMLSWFNQKLLTGLGYTVMCCLLPCCKIPSKTIPEGRRGALLKFGKLTEIRKPGKYAYNPMVDDYKVVDIRVQTLKLERQIVLSTDGVQVTVDAVCYYRIKKVETAIFSVTSYNEAIESLAKTTLEQILGCHALDDVIRDRGTLAIEIKTAMFKTAKKWGIVIESINLQDVIIPKEFARAFASSAQATKEGEARRITAEAELNAASIYAAAADKLSASKSGTFLRYLDTIGEIGQNNSTVIIPIPDILSFLKG